MTGIQLIGKAAVIDTYGDFEGNTWGLFMGKQLIIAGEGGTELEKYLDRFAPAGSTGSYTLRIYDEDTAPGQVRAGTEYACSFNFKITDTYGGAGIAGFGTLGARLEAIEKKLEAPQEDDGFTEIIMGWLREPHKLATVLGAVRGLLMPNAMPLPLPAPAQTIGGIRSPEPEIRHEMKNDINGVATDDATYDRLAAVLDTLQKHDPQILEHLEKLADIAVKKPAMFKMLLTTLDGI